MSRYRSIFSLLALIDRALINLGFDCGTPCSVRITTYLATLPSISSQRVPSLPSCQKHKQSHAHHLSQHKMLTSVALAHSELNRHLISFMPSTFLLPTDAHRSLAHMRDAVPTTNLHMHIRSIPSRHQLSIAHLSAQILIHVHGSPFSNLTI